MSETDVNDLVIPFRVDPHLPPQTAPINRSLGAVALGDGSGVQPSLDLESALVGYAIALILS